MFKVIQLVNGKARLWIRRLYTPNTTFWTAGLSLLLFTHWCMSQCSSPTLNWKLPASFLSIAYIAPAMDLAATNTVDSTVHLAKGMAISELHIFLYQDQPKESAFHCTANIFKAKAKTGFTD